MSELRVVLTTTADRESALELARPLVAEGLAACVTLLPGCLSVYEWKGTVEEEPECLLLIKTRAGRLRQLEQALRERHPYELPEMIALEPAQVERGYLAWVLDQTGD
jgi:periplasmic divalent cation tolerance protein